MCELHYLGKRQGYTSDVAEELNNYYPTPLILIDKCGQAMMEQPEEFNRLLEEWLTKSNL
jgi:hypothetical protein